MRLRTFTPMTIAVRWPSSVWARRRSPITCLKRLIIAATVLHGSGSGRIAPVRCMSLCDADGLRASELEHAVQDGDGDRQLARLPSLRAGAQCLADHPLEPADR